MKPVLGQGILPDRADIFLLKLLSVRSALKAAWCGHEYEHHTAEGGVEFWFCPHCGSAVKIT